MSIKYYHLAKDEELPEEFCAIRDEGGEPNSYVFYVPESEVAKLRERIGELEELTDGKLYIPQEWYAQLKTEDAKLRELVADMDVLLNMFCVSEDLYGCNCPAWPDAGMQCKLRDVEDRMTQLGVEVTDG